MSMNPTAFLILDDGSIWPGKWFGATPPAAENLESDVNKPPVKQVALGLRPQRGLTVWHKPPNSGNRIQGEALPEPSSEEAAFASVSGFSGELIFNTGMTGYHEILTDPSYTGQIVLFTYPHIGNYGDDGKWSEVGPEDSGRIKPVKAVKAGGLVVRSFYGGPVPRGRQTLDDFLNKNGICGISDVDTRGLTLKLRNEGSRNAVIVRASREENSNLGLSDAELESAVNYVRKLPSMAGLNLTGEVGTSKLEIFNEKGSPHVALLDCGVKMNIIRELKGRGCRVSVLPSDSTAQDVMDVKPDALLLSNGPGDPEPLEGPRAIAEALMGKLPLWGICLGLQILARAAGGSTYKMSFGHHGLNHPVRDEKTGRVFVTSQNHGFAVDEKSLPENLTVRFRNANDGSIEGLENKEMKLLCVQHHPEASPGPVDSAWVFDAFLETLKG